MKRSGGIQIIVLAAALLSGPAAASASASTADGAADANEIVRLANAVRAQHGLRPLQRSHVLDRSAVMKGEEIRGCRAFSHTPCGISFMRTFVRTGYVRGGARVGENLYWGSGSLGTPTSAIAGWLHSPPHRANLLSRGWRDVGVGTVYAPSLFGASNVRLFVLQFGRR
jgi:uncharacterized protein YkwD